MNPADRIAGFAARAGNAPPGAADAAAADRPDSSPPASVLGDSILHADWAAPEPAAASEAEGAPESSGGPSALARIYRTYAAARAAIGVALAAGIGLAGLADVRPPFAVLAVCLGYSLQSVLWWMLPPAGAAAPMLARGGAAQRRRLWLGTIGVDLLVFGALHLLASGAGINVAALLVLPVLMAGVLSSRLVALGTAAAVSLLLLLTAWYADRAGSTGAVPITQAGLAGIGFFAIALVAAELAARLAREERSARGSLELARRQARLNRLVIEEMADGVLVVDRELRVRTSNPAARSLLAVPGTGLQPNFQLQGRTEWAALAQAVRRALAEGRWPAAGEEVTLHVGAGDTRTLRMRVRFTRRKGARGWPAGEEYCVLLLEDVRTVRARIRQEKLAAMGRVSAGIAHEIRNPLAAIAQANALLLEDPLPEPQARLARIVADNVQRLRRIVDDVLEAAPSATVAAPAAVDAAAVVAAAADEWARTEGIEIGGRLRLELPRQPLMVRFDAEHLRRVLVNLLDNALRHATAAPGAIGVRLALRDEATALLLVDSDGAPIAPDVEAYMFEPFFSTRSRGTGLGLYICRELCERYGAGIEYRLRADGQRKLFLVVMLRDTPAVQPAAPAAPAAT